MDEPTLPDASNVNGTAAIGTAEVSEGTDSQNGANDTTGAERGALRPTFMSGLASAMREAAVRERERISGTVAEDAATHIEKVRSRAAIESEELRRLAEEDVEHVEQWSASEIERIKAEASQKVDDRRSSLDEYLKQHDSIIDTEIEGVDRAVRDYESTLDRFFAELAELTDPSEIVRRAGLLPPPPDLDEVRATARANAMAKFSEAEAGDAAASAPTEAVSETVEPTAQATRAVSEGESSGEVIGAAAIESSAETAESGDDGTLSGVMDDGAGSVEPAETIEPAALAEAPAVEAEPAVAEAPVAEPVAAEPVAAEPVAASAEQPSEPVAEPVGVMDPDAQRVPNWPAPAPEAPPAQIAPTIDNTSAAVRLLRSVAPWTAPTHAGNRGSNDSE